MIELKNVSFRYVASDSSALPDGSAGGLGEEVSNGSLKDISLSVSEGEFVLLNGGSGCGKTTILRLINGLIPNFYEGQLTGQVTVNGTDVSKAELYDTAKFVSTVFQNPRSQFFNVDTTSELAFACENRGMPKEEILRRMEDVVFALHLEPLMNRSLFDLSGGQKQKIACASVAVTQNKIILLDEPSANLDTKTIGELRSLLAKWKNEGKTIVVAEHRISYLWDLADRTIVLKNGEILSELDRTKMNSVTEDQLHEMGLRSHRADFGAQTKGSNSSVTRQEEDSFTVQDFRYSYRGGRKALDIPLMKIPQKKITAIVGNNGEGKTTFLNCLCGLGRRSKGKLLYAGKTYRRKARQKLLYLVMQDVNHQLFTESVLDEVLISQEEENEEEARKILSSLDLEEFADRHPMSLSGGQKQRVAVACAVASGRELLLFDEPTSGLDYTHMKQIGSILRKLKEMEKTVIVVTHDRELIDECCDEVLNLHDFNRATSEAR